MDNFYPIYRSLYTTPQQVKAFAGINVDSLGRVDSGVQDDLLLYLCEAASQKVDEFCAPRFFYPLYKTALYDWPGTSMDLNLRDDLLQLDTLRNGNGVVIPPLTTIGSSTVPSYFLYPPDVYPKYRISLNIATGNVYLFISTPQQALALTGFFGYPANEARGLWNISTAATVQDNPQTANTTTLTLPKGVIQAGETVYIDSELELVQDVVSGPAYDTCTVVRGHNGTTAALHAQGTSVYRILVHPVVSRTANRIVQWYFRQKDAADFGRLQIGAAGMQMIELPAQIPVDIYGDLAPLIRQHF